MAAGTAAVGLAFAAKGENGMKEITLDALPYAEDALAPTISARTISFHYGKHHAGYVKTLNGLIAGTQYEGRPLEDIVRTVAPAKVLSDFMKKTKKVAVKCGVVDGAYIDDKGVGALANTPSREVLIARIMGSMMSSVSKFVYCVEAIRKKQAGEE